MIKKTQMGAKAKLNFPIRVRKMSTIREARSSSILLAGNSFKKLKSGRIEDIIEETPEKKFKASKKTSGMSGTYDSINNQSKPVNIALKNNADLVHMVEEDEDVSMVSSISDDSDKKNTVLTV